MWHGVVQIDLDTIETSNLNRQFLFRKHHVGMSKAKVRTILFLASRVPTEQALLQVAAEVIQKIKPRARITAHHANVKAKDLFS